MDKKFTPGPHYAVEYAGFWEMQRQPDYDMNDNLLDAEKNDRAEYNAKLYAAAPEMYELLEGLINRGEIISDTKPILALLNRINNA